MKTVIFLAAAVLALWGLHRLSLWMESRGWVNYRRKPDLPSLGAAFLELQQMAEPSKKHVLQVKRDRVTKSEAPAGPDQAG